MKSLALLAGVTGASAVLIPSWLVTSPPAAAPRKLSHDQAPLSSSPSSSRKEGYQCDLTPALDPSEDGLPSSFDLFYNKDALQKQVKRHQAVVRVPSVCFDDLGEVDEDERWEPFNDLHKVLEEQYPTVHKKAKLEKINTFGLVYTIPGSDSSLKPILLAAHQDVVPVADASTWTHPPFSAHFDGKFLWGRGSCDDKDSLTALMSAMEFLLSSDDDWKPRRTIIYAFGFDEECGGHRGANPIGQHLLKRYGKDGVAIVLDEGGMGLVDVGDKLYALPSVSEKGHMDVWLTLQAAGGHSSIPLPHTGIGIMSEIVTSLESHPYQPYLAKDSPVYGYLTCLARHSSDLVPGLSDLVEHEDMQGLADYIEAVSPVAKFLITTSQAVDTISGGAKINALPENTKLGVNYRVTQQDTIEGVQHNILKYIEPVVSKYNLSVTAYEGDEAYAAYVAKHFPDDEALFTTDRANLGDDSGIDYRGRLHIGTGDVSHPAPNAPVTGAVWDVLAGTLQHTFGQDKEVVSTGQQMTGNTDTRHYLELTPNVYRFTPTRMDSMVGAHTIDERADMNNHMEMLAFYYNFIRNFDAADLGGAGDELTAGEL